MSSRIIKQRKLTREQIIMVLVCSILASAIIIATVMVKLFAFNNNVIYGIWETLGTVSIVTLLLVTCLLLYFYVSQPFVLKRFNYYFAYMSIVLIVVVVGIFIMQITPLLIPVAYAALLMFPLSRRNSTVFVVNTVCGLFVLFAGLLEYMVTGGNITTMFNETAVEFISELLIMCMVNIGIGGILPFAIRYKSKRTRYIVACIVFDIITLGILALLLFVNPHIGVGFNQFWLVVIAVFIPVLTSLLIVPLVESIFNLITTNRLNELTDVKHPLIARLANEAPGTFNHSLNVANFAEICANAIGEDPYLARAAAYYHDVGKLENPQYFVENQSGENILDELLPEVSAQIIRRHTDEGLLLCERYRIPDEISQITVEHHGTLPIKIFYERARQLTDGDVNVFDYSYHGKTPTSKISAIIMVCDSGEAAIRAMDKPDGERVDQLLRNLINDRIKEGQFDNCEISVKELHTIRRAIIEAYGGLYHKRVEYPSGEVKGSTDKK